MVAKSVVYLDERMVAEMVVKMVVLMESKKDM